MKSLGSILILAILAIAPGINASETYYEVGAGVLIPTTFPDADPISTGSGSVYEDW